MVETDLLLAFAQIGLVIIGLLSFLYLFISKNIFDESDGQRIKFIFNHSFALIIFSGLPLLLFYFFSAALYWRIVCYIISVFTIWSGIAAIYKIYKIPPYIKYQIIIFHIIPSFILPIFLIWKHSLASYVTTLIWLSLTSLLQFRVAFFFYLDSSKHGKTKENKL